MYRAVSAAGWSGYRDMYTRLLCIRQTLSLYHMLSIWAIENGSLDSRIGVGSRRLEMTSGKDFAIVEKSIAWSGQVRLGIIGPLGLAVQL
jgi:hypothetical protein